MAKISRFRIIALVLAGLSAGLPVCSPDRVTAPDPTGTPPAPTSPPHRDRDPWAPHRLLIYQKGDHAPRLIRETDVLERGDVVQVAYRTTAKYVAIVSVDGWGFVTVHFPEGSPCSTKVENRQLRSTLSFAFELDDAPNFEHFFMVGADVPIDVASLARWFSRTPYAALSPPHLPGPLRLLDDLRVGKMSSPGAHRPATAPPIRTNCPERSEAALTRPKGGDQPISGDTSPTAP